MKREWALHRRDYAESCERRRDFVAFLTEHYEPANTEVHELVFGELVTNAVRYGDNPMSVSVAVSDDALRIEVENSGGCFDLMRELKTAPRNTGGRGLRIVRALVDTLHVEEPDEDRCRVIVQLPLRDRR
jgi:anti-sigma regulatory factor (Ser/Thr protein kinase)